MHIKIGDLSEQLSKINRGRSAQSPRNNVLKLIVLFADLFKGILEIDRARLTLSIFIHKTLSKCGTIDMALSVVSVSLSHKSAFYRNVQMNGQMLLKACC